MKQLKREIRMLITVQLLGWAVKIMPKDKDAYKLMEAIIEYFEADLKQN